MRSCSVRFGEAEVVPRRRGSSREGRTNEPRARACAAEAVETRICGQRNPGNPENLLHRVRRSEGLCIRECRVLDYCEKEGWIFHHRQVGGVLWVGQSVYLYTRYGPEVDAGETTLAHLREENC